MHQNPTIVVHFRYKGTDESLACVNVATYTVSVQRLNSMNTSFHTKHLTGARERVACSSRPISSSSFAKLQRYAGTLSPSSRCADIAQYTIATIDNTTNIITNMGLMTIKTNTKIVSSEGMT